jgi:flagellar protein FlgJ
VKAVEEIFLQPIFARQSTINDPSANNNKPADRQDDLASDGDHGRLAKACADFEAIFVQQLFKTMRASVPESKLLDGGRAEELYTSMLDQRVAEQMAQGQGSIGLAKQMRNNLAHYLVTGNVTKMK